MITVFSWYLQSLNEMFKHFFPLGITSINFRRTENKKFVERLTEIWENNKQLYTFWNELPKSIEKTLFQELYSGQRICRWPIFHWQIAVFCINF